MNFTLSTSLRAALLLGAAALANPAKADIIYQSATAGTPPSGGFVVQGDGTTDGSNILGGVFTLTEAASITDIGGNFLVSNGASGGGNIFGEIVQIPAGATVPDKSIDQLTPLARVTFGPTHNGDTAISLSVQLLPGTYALLFGGNLTDAPGFATLADNNTPTGVPSLFQDNFGAADPSPWDNFAPVDTRIFVDGVVAEPASISLFATGLVMLGLRSRRRA
jgi:hypothetical protein